MSTAGSIPPLARLVEALDRLRSGSGALAPSDMEAVPELLAFPRYARLPEDRRAQELFADLLLAVEDLPDEAARAIATGLLVDRNPGLGLTARTDAIAAELAGRGLSLSADGRVVRSRKDYVWGQLIFTLLASDSGSLAAPRGTTLGYRWKHTCIEAFIPPDNPEGREFVYTWTIEAVRPHVRLFAFAVNPENTTDGPYMTVESSELGHRLLTEDVGIPLDATRPQGVRYWVLYLGHALVPGVPETVCLRSTSRLSKKPESWVSATAEGSMESLTLRAHVPPQLATEYACKEWRSTELTEEPFPYQWKPRRRRRVLEWQVAPTTGHYYRLEWRQR